MAEPPRRSSLIACISPGLEVPQEPSHPMKMINMIRSRVAGEAEEVKAVLVDRSGQLHAAGAPFDDGVA